MNRLIDLEFATNFLEILNLIRIRGTIASCSSTQVPAPKMMSIDLTIWLVIVYAMPEETKQQAISQVEKRLRNEQLRHVVSHASHLAGIARAQEIIEQGECRDCVVVMPERLRTQPSPLRGRPWRGGSPRKSI